MSLFRSVPYSSTKAALLGFHEALALELAAEGITVNGISPGPDRHGDERRLSANPAVSAQFLSKIPLGRWGRRKSR